MESLSFALYDGSHAINTASVVSAVVHVYFDIISCWSLLHGVYQYQFSQQYIFLYKVLRSRISSGVAIYLQNDLNISL